MKKNQTLKRALTGLLAVVMVLALAACGGSGSTTPATGDTSGSAAAPAAPAAPANNTVGTENAQQGTNTVAEPAAEGGCRGRHAARRHLRRYGFPEPLDQRPYHQGHGHLCPL